MRLRKVCPQCSTVIHARRSICECGHAFTLKREARITASSPAKRKRALKSLEDTLRRQESNRIRMASMRASETQEQTLERLEQNKTRIASTSSWAICIVQVHWSTEGLHFSAFHYYYYCMRNEPQVTSPASHVGLYN